MDSNHQRPISDQEHRSRERDRLARQIGRLLANEWLARQRDEGGNPRQQNRDATDDATLSWPGSDA
jgi:hypothetical protein